MDIYDGYMQVIRLLVCCLFLWSCHNRKAPALINYPSAGGYNYLSAEEVIDSNFFSLPMKDNVSRRDSFLIYYYNSILYKNFNEQNISIRPLEKSVFRMTYFDGALSSIKPVLIRLTEDLVTVKEGVKGSFIAEYDTMKLNPVERFHYKLLDFSYPLSDTSIKGRRRIYYDSVLKIYPVLDSPNYFRYLKDKSAVYGEEFRYKTTTYKISNNDFKRIVTLINNSEFWNCPYDCLCQNIPTDAAGFSLEANTPKKYNFISRPICPGDSSKLIIAIDELIKLGDLDNKIKVKWTERESSNFSTPPEPKDVELEDIKPN